MLRLDLLNRQQFGVTIVRCANREESDTLRILLHDEGYRWGSGNDLLVFDWYDSKSIFGADYYIYNTDKMVAIDSTPSKRMPYGHEFKTCLTYDDFVCPDEADADATDDTAFDNFLGALA